MNNTLEYAALTLIMLIVAVYLFSGLHDLASHLLNHAVNVPK